MNRPARLLFVASIVGLSAAGAAGQAPEDDQLAKDCGVHALYLLLRLCAADTDLTQLRATLPDTRADGLSLAEIRDAAARRGVTLRGRRIGPQDVPIDRPMIAHLRPGEGRGHFVVIEPVGTLGKSVMVLDFPRPPRVVAYADLIGSDAWTGLALAPATAQERFGPWIATGLGAVLVALGVAAPRLRRPGTGRGRPVAMQA